METIDYWSYRYINNRFILYSHVQIFIGKPINFDYDSFTCGLDQLKDIIDNIDEEKLFNKVEELVPTYKRQIRYKKESFD